MKKLILFLLVTVFSMAAYANDANEAVLQVWCADGQTVTFSLDDDPVTSYVDGQLVIKTTKTTVSYPLEEIRKYTYILPKKKLFGDADGNGLLETKDIIEISNKIQGNPSSGFVFDNADVNGDGIVNVADIILIITTMLTPQ